MIKNKKTQSEFLKLAINQTIHFEPPASEDCLAGYTTYHGRPTPDIQDSFRSP